MKTAISIPDPVFEAAEELAKRLGISRSQLYSVAVSSYLDNHRADEVTSALNEVYADYEAAVDPLLDQLQVRELPKEDW